MFKKKPLIYAMALSVFLTVIVFNVYGGCENRVAEIREVKVGITPFAFAMMFLAIHETGIDNEIGIDFKVVDFPSSVGTFQSLIRGDLDMINEDMSVHIAKMQNAPQIVTFGTNNLFKGFILIGRRRTDKSYKQVEEELGSAEKAKEFVLTNLKGREIVATPIFGGIISDALQQVDLTLDDIKWFKFSDDEKAAMAFIRGVGDFYLGSLPQEIKLLGMPDQFINLGGNTEIMGPASLFYGGLQTNRKYLSENYDTLLRVTAAFYRGARYLQEAIKNNDKDNIFIQIMRKNLNKRTAGTMTNEEMFNLEKNYEEIFTYERAWEVALNPESKLYWKITGNYQMKVEVSLDHLDKEVDLAKYVVWEKTYADLSKRKDLMDFINKPLAPLKRR